MLVGIIPCLRLCLRENCIVKTRIQKELWNFLKRAYKFRFSSPSKYYTINSSYFPANEIIWRIAVRSSYRLFNRVLQGIQRIETRPTNDPNLFTDSKQFFFNLLFLQHYFDFTVHTLTFDMFVEYRNEKGYHVFDLGNVRHKCGLHCTPATGLPASAVDEI
jgi:hypothetical protein